MIEKEISVYQQTRALLYRNFLKKWRLRKETLLEWTIPLLLMLNLSVFSDFTAFRFPEQPPHVLGRVDQFNESNILVTYAPVTNTTRKIMDKMALAPFMKGAEIIGTLDEETMNVVHPNNNSLVVGVVFNNAFSYTLKFNWGYRLPIIKEHAEHSAHCWLMDDDFSCTLTRYWQEGFVAFQTAINAAIIEVTTNHSVMEKLTSVVGINMRTPSFISWTGLLKELFIFTCLLCFSSFVHFASLNVTRERKKFKKAMTIMGLQESAFWLSWGLMYSGFIFITSTSMTLVITSVEIFLITGYMVVFTLFILYGLSLIALVFLLSVLVKKPILTCLVGFLFTVFWGCLGFIVLHRQLPSSLGWILSLFSPFAFSSGMVHLSRLEYYLIGATFPDHSGESHIMIATFFILVFDTVLYLILTLYFERVLPDEDGRCQSPLFFLKSSFWFQNQNTNHEVFENEIDSSLFPEDFFEPVSPEFHGKEAIRIRNVKKEYNGKPEEVEALKGIFLDIYEGQITAILGHRGAGKSTLLNILSGLSVLTKGSVTIYNTQLSDIPNMEEKRKDIGFCPQFNIQFDFLTVKENLRLFAKIKGIHPKEVEQEVKRIIMELDIQSIQDVTAQKLNDGQKRKLTFGIAILGDPQVLLLDEPTAGLDPFSRHQVWNLLKECKTNHVILLSTQFMDEADILADRKVFLSNGKLKCAGSSLFLKKKWGVGYHLSLHRNEMCDSEKITALIRKHIPDTKLTTESEEQLVYSLPLNKTNRFPGLFSDLDKCSLYGIMNYGVSMTTLNEVFLNLEGKSATDDPDFSTWKEDTRENGHESETRLTLSSLPEMSKFPSSGSLWRQQVLAVARLRFLRLRRERKALFSLLLVLGIAFIPIICEKAVYMIFRTNHHWELSPSLYFLSPNKLPQTSLTSLLIINNTGSNIEDLVQSLKHQDIILEIDDFRNRNGSDDPSYNGAIIVSGDQKDYRFSVACNTKKVNCYPVLMGIVSNALLGIFKFMELIKTERSAFPLEKTQSQLRISGLFPSAYWCGQALVDIPLYYLILISVYLFINFMFSEFKFPLKFVFALAFCLAGCAVSIIFLTYMISFIFRKRKKRSGFWGLGFFVISLFVMMILVSTYFGKKSLVLCIIFVPIFTPIESLFILLELTYLDMNSENLQNEIYEESETILLTILVPYLHCAIFIFVIRYLEMKYGKETTRKDPIFRISPKSRKNHPNPQELEEEDEDVQAERMKTANELSTPSLNEKPVILASCLHKEYKEKKSCFSARKKKIAIRNVSFCVNKGEVLGLLGHNGAGKSTALKMIAGAIQPTAGMVISQDCRASPRHQADDHLRLRGYCPQENALWPDFTVKEHLELHAAVRGLGKEDAALSISRLVDILKLQEQLTTPMKTLPKGVKRKLCFALSILGNPSVVLLDEPSMGMDPKEQKQIWQTIRTTVKNKERGILLATNNMAEAEAVCDRVAILVSGKLRCIGSIQQMKSKFGKDYLLEVKMKDPTQVEPLNTEILKLFPQAAWQRRYFSMMVYKVPVEGVHPLSQAFFKLEAVKQTFNLEEYILSQATLEQVFLEFSKEQELGNFDEVDTTDRSELLPEEEP
ncbi:ATP-binding cassette sub-family A member 10 isoform X2 [Erinaceus europaeus]|uniref:ATP-binding cassette sub-family A member 10 isoform X2 n=1 Tax=Erinaceus europaeus TaxID=9365 RepID=A0ABM3YC42_ERIEU|nr:ATP-binding cassette sub-family A member 10 isoform X2 [Erinaceus europaeus]